jgi:RNA-directed DNA polymerase
VSVNRLAFILGVDLKKLVDIAQEAKIFYRPFDSQGRKRPFQRKATKTRRIDNPVQELKRIQDIIQRQLLRPICFPNHIIGGVSKRSVEHNAGRHLRGATLLVTIDVRKCFPSITNKHVYHVWRNVLGCAPRVSAFLTKLTTVNRCLPQGSPASPLIANLFIWSIDSPIRAACERLGLIYSTFIDDLAFSGTQAREMIQISGSVLAEHGLRISHKKIRIMGPKDSKLLTGTRFGKLQVRAPHEKISRVRSGIHNLRIGLVPPQQQPAYIDSLIGQLRYIERLCTKDAILYIHELAMLLGSVQLTRAAAKYLITRTKMMPSPVRS